MVLWTVLIGLHVLFALVLVGEAIRDVQIFIKGGFDEDTNPCDVPVEQLEGLANNPRFIRTVAGVRLAFALTVFAGLIWHML